MTNLNLSYFYLVLFFLKGLIMAGTSSEFDYCNALEKSLLFFKAQRSGILPPDQTVKWRGHTGLQDGFAQGVSFSRPLYLSRNNSSSFKIFLKTPRQNFSFVRKELQIRAQQSRVGSFLFIVIFTSIMSQLLGHNNRNNTKKNYLPFLFLFVAFAMTILSWSVIEFQQEIAACDQLGRSLDAIRWGTDYLIKAHTEPNTLWAQVGNGYSEHRCWERPKDMSTPRTSYKVDSNHPGSDIVGKSAAAMAAASIAFSQYDSTYSGSLLFHAKQLFSFADTYRGQYDDVVSYARDYYPSMGYNDELLWAAAWLYKATNDDKYLNYIVKMISSMDSSSLFVGEFSWENKYAGLEVLLSKVLMDNNNATYKEILDQLKDKAELFLCACVLKNDHNNIARTPGYLYRPSSSTLNCTSGQMKPSEIVEFAQSQTNYIIGKNPNSLGYLVGYQSKCPTHVHHRGASIPSVLATSTGCYEGYSDWYWRKESNPNVILEALVGGPNLKYEFMDRRYDYVQNEPVISGNAPPIGIFARMANLSSGKFLKDPSGARAPQLNAKDE